MPKISTVALRGGKIFYLADTFQGTGDSQYTIVNTRDDFTDSGFDTSLISQIRDVLALFSNYNSGFFCRDEGAESDLRCGIFFVGGSFAIILAGSGQLANGSCVGLAGVRGVSPSGNILHHSRRMR